ncbi:tyrosine phosphatase protein [Rutstroemia sp. NJR-2017a BBW]|nr:tyrosine phosphatase protein [Rutstroemia sp. NJR-2017a BBW]
MGQQISAVVEKFDDDSAKQKLADDAMNSLLEMAKLQVAAFKLAISNPNFEAKLIPIEKILSSDSVIQASIENTPTNIGSVITDSFSAFASGEVVKGITTIINSGLKILLGTYSGNISTRDIYLISTGKIGGVFRVDIHFFAYRFRSDQLKSVTKEVLSVSIVISSAELNGLSDNTLRNIVQQTYSASTSEEQQSIYEQIKAARDNVQKPANPDVRLDRNTHAKLHFQRAIDGMRARGKESLASGAKPRSEHVDVSEEFEIRTPIGRAYEQCPAMDAWIRGGITAAFGHETKEISVACTQSGHSTSDSLIYGLATVSVAKSKVQAAQDKLVGVINNLLKSAASPGLSDLTIDSFSTQADKAGLFRFEWVKGHIPDADRLARSSAPHYIEADSDQKLPKESIQFLKDNKIEHVISINSQADNETIKATLKANGIAYTPLPVKDFTAPTSDQLKKGNENYKKHRAGTLVWCGYGHGRTGTMVTGLQIYAEKDKTSPTRLSQDEYKSNHVEKNHNGKSTGQYEVLDALQG